MGMTIVQPRETDGSPESACLRDDPAHPTRLLLVTANQHDHDTIQRLAEFCAWEIHHATSYRQLQVDLRQRRPDVIITADRLQDADWRQVLWSALDFVNVPALIVMADCIPARLRYCTATWDIRWLLERPLNECAVLRAVMQAQRRSLTTSVL